MNDRYHADLTIEASWEDDKVSNKYVEGVDWSPNIYIENIIKGNILLCLQPKIYQFLT